MERRHFLISGVAAAAALGAGLYYRSEDLPVTVEYPGRADGHRLRAGIDLPAGPRERCGVAIIGSGVAAVAAAWRLARAGYKDFVALEGPERFGNAAGGQAGDCRYPTGAHYLPLPSLESTHVRALLAEYGVILRNPDGAKPTYDERYLLHAPGERSLYRGQWYEGYLPVDAVSGVERGQIERFFAQIDAFTGALGADGRRAFVVPSALASMDPHWRALDAQSFAHWLDANRYDAPTLRWYLDYCCRDDYGRGASEVSAWAGLHYFCARNGDAENAERGAVLTWPGGLSELVDRIATGIGWNDHARPGFAYRIERRAEGVRVHCADSGAATSFMLEAEAVVLAVPLFVARHVDPELGARMPTAVLPRSAPWVVSNFVLDAFPEEQKGAPLAWDNVVVGSSSLGYVVSTHQDLARARPAQTVFTAYHALAERPSGAARAWLDRASAAELTHLAALDLRTAYGWRLGPCVQSVRITARGHAMAYPSPGFLDNPALSLLRRGDGPVQYAHSDLSSFSVFEEASYWGVCAADRILARLGGGPTRPDAV